MATQAKRIRGLEHHRIAERRQPALPADAANPITCSSAWSRSR
ncbi:hypothetical protein JOF55_004834 [Haloactinomyces albus]|uniref:Uncharacterized protein n=1 Tax=Haloactinomyces albus TaxID=1352928 RepID=A0AAE3ZI59_9ACTN|nr:hypothetical protein [Haloactinomyces albus]